jgi:hypothetical protein
VSVAIVSVVLASVVVASVVVASVVVVSVVVVSVVMVSSSIGSGVSSRVVFGGSSDFNRLAGDWDREDGSLLMGFEGPRNEAASTVGGIGVVAVEAASWSATGVVVMSRSLWWWSSLESI